MLPRARQIRETQIDHLDVLSLDGFEDIVGRGATQKHLLPSRVSNSDEASTDAVTLTCKHFQPDLSQLS
jgi:hypothetical protein